MKGGEKMKNMKWLHGATFALMVVGALNWGLVGLFRFNLVSAVLGSWPTLEMLVYVLVGLSAVYIVVTHPGYCKYCKSK